MAVVALPPDSEWAITADGLVAGILGPRGFTPIWRWKRPGRRGQRQARFVPADDTPIVSADEEART